VNDVLPHRERLTRVELAGEDLFEQGAFIPFFQRIVKLFAPIVGEIAKRSPNPAELSLKQENDAGRREEVYVKKQDLMGKLAALDEQGRAVFAPLWLPRDEQPEIDITMDEL
jgi:hypothetical protein